MVTRKTHLPESELRDSSVAIDGVRQDISKLSSVVEGLCQRVEGLYQRVDVLHQRVDGFEKFLETNVNYIREDCNTFMTNVRWMFGIMVAVCSGILGVAVTIAAKLVF